VGARPCPIRAITESFDPNSVRAAGRVYTDLFVSQGFGDDRVNPGFTYPVDKSNYDLVGRSFTAGLKMTF
jgi:hypothetical protein